MAKPKDIKMTALPIENNPTADRLKVRKTARLNRLIESIMKGDKRIEVAQELESLKKELGVK